jgi:hypothetical protein
VKASSKESAYAYTRKSALGQLSDDRKLTVIVSVRVVGKSALFSTKQPIFLTTDALPP